MTAIATTNFHTSAARQFTESITEADEVYYLFVGRTAPWAEGDSIPNTPDDSTANTCYAIWDNIMAFRRITASDLSYVLPRNDWTANGKYSMYTHSTPMSSLISNTDNPFYVVTSNNSVFKCISNGKANSASEPSNTVTEPTITGQDDLSALTYSDGDPIDYVWKYMYSIPTLDAAKFMTSSYIPVKDIFSTLDANGDINNDSSGQYTVFNNARISGNGSILKISVDTPGSGYSNPPTVTVYGDGSVIADASAVVTSNQVSQINVINGGANYTKATVTITANGDSGSGATATAIISPRTWFTNSSGTFYRSAHGINPVDELGSTQVMIYVSLAGAGDDNLLVVGNEYRQVGIIKNPILYGTSNVATSNTYSQTTDLELTNISSGDSFNIDEIVWQQSTNAFGVVASSSGNILRLTNITGTFSNSGITTIKGIGNGNTTGMIANSSVTISAVPESFTPVVSPSSTTADVVSVGTPAFTPYSGTILYIDNRVPVMRSSDQTEIIRIILNF